MYITMFGAITSTIMTIIFNKLNYWYALYFCIMTFVGTYPGLLMQYYLVKKTGRKYITPLLLLFFIVFSLTANVSISISTLV